MKVSYLLAAGLLTMGIVAAPMLRSVTADDTKEAVEKSDSKPAVEEKADEAKPEAKKYWLGVQLTTTPEILSKHVERLKDGAAMVAGVAPGSPAEKAGLQAGDHLLKVNDTVVKMPEDVVKAVDLADGKALNVRVLRGLEVESFTVQLEEAPDMPEMGEPRVEALGENGLGGMVPPGARFRFFGPGQMVPPQMRLRVMGEDMPGNMTIRMEQNGDEPAKLHIERDGESYDVTEKNIDTLPEDLQPLAKRYLSQGGMGNIILGGKQGALIPNMPAMPNHGEFQKRMQQEMQQMHEMIRQMHERMEHMQGVPPQPMPEKVVPNNTPNEV